MAKSITSDDARQMIALYDSLERRLTAVLDVQNANRERISQYAAAIMNSTVFSDSIIDDMRREIRQRPRTFDSTALITALYDDMAMAPYIQKCREPRDQHQGQIRHYLSALRAAASSIRWFFTGGKAKSEASLAYSSLSELLSAEYKPTIDNAEHFINAIRTTSEKAKLNAFETQPDTYRAALKASGLINLDSVRFAAPLAELLSQHQAITDTYQSACLDGARKADSAKENIKNAVDYVLLQQIMKQLRGFDVDALGQKRSGLRTKALKDAGYKTVEDVYCATESNIASVHGISPDAASQIKDAARDIAANIEARTKLKISTDDKTGEVNRLVMALYAYQKCTRSLDTWRETLSEGRKTVERYVPVLTSLKNNLVWLFATDNERNSFIQAYQHLTALTVGSYPSDISAFKNEISGGRPILADDAWNDFSQNSIAYFNTLEEIVPGVLGNSDTLYGLPEALARKIQDQTFFPQGLKVKLRRYQEWGVKYILHQERVLLGDEMGLGKTVQAIATMVSLRNTGATHFLVVCPASVLPNWCKEIDKKSQFRSTKIHGGNRQTALNDWIKNGGVAVTTYETTNNISMPPAFHYDLLVVDEAHYIKNEDALRSKNVRALGQKARRILFMTGTALENKVEEMISLIQVLQPVIASRIKDIAFMSAAPQFREEIAPVYYRRKREDVLSELPEITETKEWCDLLPDEEKLYESAVLRKDQTAIRRVSWINRDLSHSSKARRMKEIIDEARDDKRKVLVFSYYLDTIGTIKKYLGTICTEPINGSVPVERRQEIIDIFETMPDGSVLLAQIQAGGTGLNIQSASVVIICEPQLKPSIENQAISRAYRMGQTRKVLVYRLLASNTIDERLDDMLEEKQKVFDAFADKSYAAQMTNQQESGIDNKTFGKLIQEEIDRINAKNGVNPASDAIVSEKPLAVKNGVDPASDTVASDKPLVEQIRIAKKDDTTKPTINAESAAKPAKDTPPSSVTRLKMEPVSAQAKADDLLGHDIMAFPTIDSLIEYLTVNHVDYKDNRPKNGCLWIKADALTRAEAIRVDGKKLNYSKSPKALNGSSGWYIS